MFDNRSLPENRFSSGLCPSTLTFESDLYNWLHHESSIWFVDVVASERVKSTGYFTDSRVHLWTPPIAHPVPTAQLVDNNDIEIT